ncbi:MAG TPA: C4-type zinc ribbon domain-containing protein [Candidatus Dormibacteraeota bacterium]|nr:C4-type zinc ribbon domain-containing protein [Candidatus Dormibacteraeota bacterium]
MNSAQLLLRYQALVDRERALRESIASTEERLESDPAVVEREAALASARAQQDEVASRLRESDKVREDHRSRLRSREKELMSGRIRNPTELMQMSDEVAHMKARFAEEEEAELRIMEDAEAADDAVRTATLELEAARRASAEDEPGLRTQLAEWQGELADVVGDKESVWSQVPPRDQALFNRIRVRPPIAPVTGSQCSACHVTVTSSGMQVLRKGEALVQCENCGRILVTT